MSESDVDFAGFELADRRGRRWVVVCEGGSVSGYGTGNDFAWFFVFRQTYELEAVVAA